MRDRRADALTRPLVGLRASVPVACGLGGHGLLLLAFGQDHGAQVAEGLVEDADRFLLGQRAPFDVALDVAIAY